MVQRVTTSDNEWQPVVISAKEEPTTRHLKVNSLNLEEDLEEKLLN